MKKELSQEEVKELMESWLKGYEMQCKSVSNYTDENGRIEKPYNENFDEENSNYGDSFYHVIKSKDGKRHERTYRSKRKCWGRK